MKNKFIKTLFVAGTVATASLALTACGADKNKNPILPKYEICDFDSHFDYNETFSMVGAKLKITMSDGTIKEVEITDDMIKEMPDMTTPGTKTVIIVYEGVEYSITITIAPLKELRREVIGVKEFYSLNESLNLADLKLVIHYENGTDKTVPITQSMLSNVNMATGGLKTITVTYEGKTSTFEIHVVDTAKNELALNKIETFLNELDREDIKKSSLKINISGSAKFLQDNADDINYQILNIVTETNNLNLKDFDLYMSDNNTYVCYKQFDNGGKMDAYARKIQNMYAYTDLHIIFLLNFEHAQFNQDSPKDGPISQIIIEMSPSIRRTSLIRDNGRSSFDECKQYLNKQIISENLQSFTPQDNKTLANLLVTSIVFAQNEGPSTGIYINTAVGKQAYKEIIKLILKASGQIKSENITDPDNLKASVDLVKTFAQISENGNAQDFVNWMFNNILSENDEYYVAVAKNLLAQVFGISDTTALNNLEQTLTSQFSALRTNLNIETIYNTIIALNSIIKDSGENEFFVNQLNNLVSGLDGKDPHMASKIAYEFRHFAQIETREFKTTKDANVLSENPGENKRRVLERIEGDTYYYYDAQSVPNADVLINKYFDALTSIIESIENVNKETDVKQMANGIIANLRSMDEVVQEINSHGGHDDGSNPDKWWNVAITDFGFDFIRMAVNQYKQMYDQQVIKALIDAMGKIYPEDFFFNSMVMKDDKMQPTIKKGEHLITKYIKNPKSGDINVGDIIVNEYGTCARVIAIFEENGTIYYVTHCDNDLGTDGNSHNEGYQWDIDRLSGEQQNLNNAWVHEHCQNVLVRDNQSEICLVVDHTPLYLPLQLPEHLITMLTNCTTKIYQAFNVQEGNIDYVQLIESLCEEFNLQKEYYIQQYNEGNLHIVRDIAEKTLIVHNTEDYEGEDKAIFDACLAMCDWLDGVILQQETFDVTTCIGKIHTIAEEMNTYFQSHPEEANGKVQMLLPFLTIMTDTNKDWKLNLKTYVDNNNEMLSTIIAQGFCKTIPDITEEGIGELKTLVSKHLDAYVKNEFDVQALIGDFTGFIDTYANESGKAIYKSGVVLAMILANANNNDVDYEKLFENVNLPDEIDEIDFNKLINETLKDKDVYSNLITIEDVDIQFVKNEQGEIIKEVLTLTIKTQYDILISAMDMSTTLTFEINFY